MSHAVVHIISASVRVKDTAMSSSIYHLSKCTYPSQIYQLRQLKGIAIFEMSLKGTVPNVYLYVDMFCMIWKSTVQCYIEEEKKKKEDRRGEAPLPDKVCEAQESLGTASSGSSAVSKCRAVIQPGESSCSPGTHTWVTIYTAATTTTTKTTTDTRRLERSGFPKSGSLNVLLVRSLHTTCAYSIDRIGCGSVYRMCLMALPLQRRCRPIVFLGTSRVEVVEEDNRAETNFLNTYSNWLRSFMASVFYRNELSRWLFEWCGNTEGRFTEGGFWIIELISWERFLLNVEWLWREFNGNLWRAEDKAVGTVEWYFLLFVISENLRANYWQN